MEELLLKDTMAIGTKGRVPFCPFHDKEIGDIEGDLREIKTTVSEMKDSCAAVREDCRKEMYEKMEARPTGKTLISLMSIFLVVALAALGLFSLMTSLSINSMKEEITSLKMSDRALTGKINSIQKMLVKISFGQKITPDDLIEGEGNVKQ